MEAAIAGDGGIDDDQYISSGAESAVDLEMDRESELWLPPFDSAVRIRNQKPSLKNPGVPRSHLKFIALPCNSFGPLTGSQARVY